MTEIYFLSIFEEYVRKILDGTKKWEFRENPDFGKTGEYLMKPEDHVLIVSTGDKNVIPCICSVERILRGDEYTGYFRKTDSEIWEDTGCPEGCEEADEFKDLIIRDYRTALKLITIPFNVPIDVSTIVHLWTGKPWTGRGFGHIEQLKRFGINGKKVKEYFDEIIRQLI
ncbi:MAG: ASCH domain-containing protein [bacterium]|nr:ASCH domain-containing protein [bacterium]